MLAFVLLTAFSFSDGSSQSTAATERIIHVGQIYINGADDMSSSAILNALPFQTGDVISAVRLREAQCRLDRLGLFVVDKATGVRPNIAELPDGALTNLRITVQLRTPP